MKNNHVVMQQQLKSWISMPFIALLLTACQPIDISQPATSMFEHAHHAENSLDWNGVYTGIVPCADCAGIATTLTLHLDKTYKIKEVYRYKDHEKIFKSEGYFQFNVENPSIIQLDKYGNERYYFVAEGYLKLIDREGKDMTSVLKNAYQLNKETSSQHSPSKINTIK